jgi:hypothetical protein
MHASTTPVQSALPGLSREIAMAIMMVPSSHKTYSARLDSRSTVVVVDGDDVEVLSTSKVGCWLYHKVDAVVVGFFTHSLPFL